MTRVESIAPMSVLPGGGAPPSPRPTPATPGADPPDPTEPGAPHYPEVVPESSPSVVPVPAAPPSPENESARTVYTCRMHPDVTAPGPVRCPACGMNLVLKTEGG